ncbi:hypothetical protein J2W42_005294 [Rhizobium tibeticum]|uniref:Uncharacterized protein n=2 Tax=Rhizobium tibeticum TaxID=501024 RepID=A0A1H8WIK2_9HYPH|nr:hypothetical protein [Rhizobium tibeticum]SEI20776.1 hypothetical protein RTCCBAU85039_6472 [Rhizobium tibeticum]SEP27514.1 hypothetical protein SAMN05216228_10666 [Rhizobium tibeticum]
MSSMLALHVFAAERGDGLRPEFVEALKRQALIDRLPLSRNIQSRTNVCPTYLTGSKFFHNGLKLTSENSTTSEYLRFLNPAG